MKPYLRGVATILGRRLDSSRLLPNKTNNVIMYHSIGGDGYDSISVSRFRDDVEFIANRYEVVDLPEVIDEPGQEKKVALTFDDGYLDFHENALPVLRELSLPATVFVIARGLTEPDFSHDVTGDYQYMTRGHLSSLAEEPSVTIGNHTKSHPDLTRAGADTVEEEVIGAKNTLEEELGKPVERFCYPYNRFDRNSLDVVRRSHDYAVCGAGSSHAISLRTNPYLIPRIDGSLDRRHVEYKLTELSAIATGIRGR